MKCDSCKHLQFHGGGSWQAVAEGGDDPYSYEYCLKQGWSGDPIVDQEQEGKSDPWADCEHFGATKVCETKISIFT